MTDLTEKWKSGELESLGELVKQIEEVDNRRALSDEYLIERDEAPRSEYAPAEEWGYGIVWAMSDYVLPYLKELQALNKENQQLKELLNYIRDEIADMPVYAKQMGFGWISEAAYRIDNAIGEKK